MGDETFNQDNNMTDEEIRITVAEACGLFRFMPLKRTTRRMKDDPNGVRLWYCDHHHGGAAEYVEVPFYPTDLNAMHEAVNNVPDELRLAYRRNLNLAANGLSVGALRKLSKEQQEQAFWQYANATARHRAEAFLRTLNLWKD